MTEKAFKYRFYPTTEQADLLSRTFGCTRFVYNAILQWRDACYQENKQVIRYQQANAKLTAMKADPALSWLTEVSSVPLQQCLRHQEKAFTNFFKKRAKHPVLKKKSGHQSFTLTRAAFTYQDGQIYIAKNKTPIDIRWSRPLPCLPTSLTISRDPSGRYFVSCLCDVEPVALPVINAVAGIDLGLTDLVVTDEGKRLNNPHHFTKHQKRLAFLQRQLSKKKKGSKNQAKAKHKVAKLHARIADCRQDNLHKTSRTLINENQVVCAESLKIKNMIRNPKLAKSIADAGWGILLSQLQYKAEWAGRTLVTIDTFFPSTKTCSCCKHVVPSMPLSIREWDCPFCQAHHDRDQNAAKNIKAEGLSVLAHGATVIPGKASALQGLLQ